VFAYQEELDRWMQHHARQDVAARVHERLAANQQSREKLLAIQGKLQSWRIASQLPKTLDGRFEQNRRNRFTFMSTDLDAALTLAKIAEGTSDERKKARNESNARRALDTVLGLYRTASLTDDECKFLGEKIADVRTALERLASRPPGRI